LWPIVVFKAPDNPRFPPNKYLGVSISYVIMKVMKHNRVISSISIVGLAALIALLFFTSPTEIGPFGVLLFFTTLYISVFGIITLIMQVFYKLALGRSSFNNKDYLSSAVLSFGPIMLLMARSFGVINLWTIGLIIFFLFLAEFLVAKRV